MLDFSKLTGVLFYIDLGHWGNFITAVCVFQPKTFNSFAQTNVYTCFSIFPALQVDFRYFLKQYDDLAIDKQGTFLMYLLNYISKYIYTLVVREGGMTQYWLCRMWAQCIINKHALLGT